MSEPRGWYSRGYLPHIDAGSQPQFLTWHLGDALPAEVVKRWRAELERLPDSERRQTLYRRVEAHLDQGFGSCLLSNPVAGSIVQGALLFYHGRHYDLSAWTVMPNHVHALLTPFEDSRLGAIVMKLKSYTSTEIHRRLGGGGRLWQEDYFDRLIRDERHFERVAKYIEWNAVKARLCQDPSHWVLSSANPTALERLHSERRVLARSEPPRTGVRTERPRS